MEAEKTQLKRSGEAAHARSAMEASHSLTGLSDHGIYYISLVDSKFHSNMIVSCVNFLQEGKKKPSKKTNMLFTWQARMLINYHPDKFTIMY